MIKGRFAAENEALLGDSYAYLPLKNNEPNDPRIFAMIKWSGTNVVFVFNNLWGVGTVEQTFYIPPDIADQAAIQGGHQYRLVNILSGQQEGTCLSGDALKITVYVKMDAVERVQWLRLELCN